MRYSLLLLPAAIIGLSGCASGGVPASSQTMTMQTTRVSDAGYLTPQQSSGLIILPGDTTTPAQLQYLSATRQMAPDWQMASSDDSSRKDTSDLMAANIPR